jgi:hypothetical protein
MRNEEVTRGLLEAAGFDEVRIAEVEVRFPLSGVEQYIDFTADTGGPLGLAVRGLSTEDRAALRAEIEPALEPFASGDAYELPGVALCAVAS